MDEVHLKEIQNSYAPIQGEITLQFVSLGLTFSSSKFVVSHSVDYATYGSNVSLHKFIHPMDQILIDKA